MTTSSQDLVSQLIELSNQIGSDTEYTRSGGGNSSAKTGDTLLIKPSGVPLATLREEDLVPLDIPTLLHAFEHPEELPSNEDPVRAAAQLAQRGAFERRPSVEILFHALIPDPLVIHLHPLTANAITCNTRGEELCEQILGDQALWVDYTDPGIPLARLIDERRRAFTTTHNTPDILNPCGDRRGRHRLLRFAIPGGGSLPSRGRRAECRAVNRGTISGCFSSWRSVDPRSDRVRGFVPRCSGSNRH